MRSRRFVGPQRGTNQPVSLERLLYREMVPSGLAPREPKSTLRLLQPVEPDMIPDWERWR